MYCMYMLRVPIGSSRGPSAASIFPTDLAFASIADRTCKPDRQALDHFGKLLVYTVRPGAPEVEEFPALAPIEAMRSFAALLEHFYHAPNSGRFALCCCNGEFYTTQAQFLSIGVSVGFSSRPKPGNTSTYLLLHVS